MMLTSTFFRHNSGFITLTLALSRYSPSFMSVSSWFMPPLVLSRQLSRFITPGVAYKASSGFITPPVVYKACFDFDAALALLRQVLFYNVPPQALLRHMWFRTPALALSRRRWLYYANSGYAVSDLVILPKLLLCYAG